MSDYVEMRPRAIAWFRGYTFAVAVLYAAILVTGIYLYITPEALEGLKGVGPDEAKLAVIVYLSVGAVFTVVFAGGLLLKREPWHWLAGALLIAMSLGLCVTLIPGFIMFYAWLQPDVRHWFGRD